MSAKLVTANARGGVGCAKAGPQPRTQLLQHLVPNGVTESVVDRLEPVEVEHHERDLFALAASPSDRLLQAVEEQRPVGEVGQRVVERSVLERLLHAPALRAVADHRHGVAAGRSQRDLDHDHGTISSPQAQIGARGTHQPRRPAGVEPPPVVDMLPAQPGGHEDLHVATDQLRAPVSRHVFCLLVGEHDHAVAIRDQDRVRHPLEHDMVGGRLAHCSGWAVCSHLGAEEFLGFSAEWIWRRGNLDLHSLGGVGHHGWRPDHEPSEHHRRA